jgi:hypothetical protein
LGPDRLSDDLDTMPLILILASTVHHADFELARSVKCSPHPMSRKVSAQILILRARLGIFCATTEIYPIRLIAFFSNTRFIRRPQSVF